MNVKEILRRKIQESIKEFDFEEYLEQALEEVNVSAIVEAKIEQHIDNIDFEDVITRAIDDIFEDEFDDYEISEAILELLED